MSAMLPPQPPGSFSLIYGDAANNGSCDHGDDGDEGLSDLGVH